MRILSFIILIILLLLPKQQTDSPHGAGFTVSCNKCHSTEEWKFDKTVYSFDHNATKMPLEGQHSVVNCKQCHPTLVFSEAKTGCIDCHTDMHQQTTGSECSRCHTPVSWLVNNTNEIHQMSRFPLLGAHRTADCNQCHKSESQFLFNVLGVECVDCHREDYMATTSPNHIQAGLSEDCAYCHPVNVFQWTSSGFNHSFFPLVQAHATPTCAQCHTTGNYADATPECYACHQQDYLGTTNPDHTATNFPTNCQECHTLNPSWKPATFDHSIFALTLGHSNVACLDCHINGNYTSTPTDCYSCHQTDYNNTANPGHLASGFPTTCQDCHTTNPGWKPASYTQHDSQSFPIYSGRHQGEWDACTDCHTDVSDYGQFSCLNCHEHNKTDTDNQHQGEDGYSYNSNECYRCHPRGDAD